MPGPGGGVTVYMALSLQHPAQAGPTLQTHLGLKLNSLERQDGMEVSENPLLVSDSLSLPSGCAVPSWAVLHGSVSPCAWGVIRTVGYGAD